jgi:hypothetical protein
MNAYRKMPYFIRVMDIDLFNTLYKSAEDKGVQHKIHTGRNSGYYELHTDDRDLWRELSLYAQMLAQAQDSFIETGEERG